MPLISTTSSKESIFSGVQLKSSAIFSYPKTAFATVTSVISDFFEVILFPEDHSILVVFFRHSKVFTFPEFFCSKRLQLRDRGSSNKSPLISAVNYITSLFSTFITCNATQHRLLWIMMGFSTCSPNKPTPLIVIITMCKSWDCEDLADIHCLQNNNSVKYKWISPSNEGKTL